MLEAETETNEEEVTEEAYHDDKRSRVKDYKMPRRKTTRRRRLQKVMDYYSEDQTNEDNSDEVIDLIDTRTAHTTSLQFPEHTCGKSKPPAPPPTHTQQHVHHSDGNSSNGGMYSDSQTTHQVTSRAPNSGGSGICDSKVGQSLEAVQK